MRTLAVKDRSNTKQRQGDVERAVIQPSHRSLSSGVLQRKPGCACGGGCPRCQTKLKISEPGDRYEQEADRIADQVMRMPEPSVQRQVEPEEEEEERVQRKAIGNPITPLVQRQVLPEMEEEEEEVIQTKTIDNQAAPSAPTQESSEVPSIVHEVLRSPGQPLDPVTRAFMEPRFGHDFSQVRVHSDQKAAESSRALHALGYTVGRDMVFGPGQYAPGTSAGQRLIAHELTHVMQQEASPPSAAVVQRQPGEGVDADVVAEREYGNSGAPKAQSCGSPSWCPAGFCSPHRSEKLAEYYRAKNGGIYLAGISAVVDSRVVPFWQEYLSGGSDPKNITADFSKDFTNSPTTKKTTTFLSDELKKSLVAKPPSVAVSSKTSIDIAKLIPTAIAALDDPTSLNQMNFSAPRDIPGNLAGGIGKDQKACPAGAKRSPFNDERHASGTVELTRKSGPDITVTPSITYSVKDTVDLCPGNCGSPLEQIATVPLSQFEATGISGDVPFTVEFPAPSPGSFTISAPPPTSPAPAPAPVPKKP